MIIVHQSRSFTLHTIVANKVLESESINSICRMLCPQASHLELAYHLHIRTHYVSFSIFLAYGSYIKTMHDSTYENNVFSIVDLPLMEPARRRRWLHAIIGLKRQ